MAGNDAISTLRMEIDRKYKEAIQALETISGYLSALPAEPGQQRQVERPIAESDKTRVSIVLAAIAQDYKTVEQLESELGLEDHAIRAVLYSKFVKAKIQRKKLGKKFAFRCKPTAPAQSAPASNNGHAAGESAASLVRDVLTKHPNGLTAGDVVAKVSADLERIGSNKAAVGAALYNMKNRGKVSHDETGVYRLKSLA